MKPEIDTFLRQGIFESSSLEDARHDLVKLAGRIGELRRRLSQGRSAVGART